MTTLCHENETYAIAGTTNGEGQRERVDATAAVIRQEAVVAVGRRVIAPPDLTELTLEAAANAAEACQVDGFGCGELTPDGKELRFRLGTCRRRGAGQRIEEHRIELATGASINSYVLQTRMPVVVTAMAEDARFHDQLMIDQGIVSGIVCPLVQQSRNFGTIGIFSRDGYCFVREDVLFVESISHMLAATMARQWAEQALASQSQFSATMMETLEAPVLQLTPEGQIRNTNAACEKITGFTNAEVKGRNVCSAFLIPEELTVMKSAFESLHRGESPVRFESFILTKDGRRRRMSWSFAAVRNPKSGHLESMLGTGIDTTEKHDALARLEQAERAARRAVKSLNELQKTVGSRELEFDGEGDVPTYLDADRRRQPRRAFPYNQSLAFVRKDGSLPMSSEFHEVLCNDLSAHGFSFFYPAEPREKQIVVAFGTQASLIYLTAEVVHLAEVNIDGKPMVRVGCRYTGRASY